MDLSLNKIHRILLDAGMPSTIEDLKAPTEDYVVNLLKTFLMRLNVDVKAIDQPTAEQYNVMTYLEDSNITNIINIHTVLVQIFNKIFINDFNVTDITDPERKRHRKQARFIANFMLYMMQKKAEFNDKMEEIQDKVRLLNGLKEKKVCVQEDINNKAVYISKQRSLIKKLESDIEHIFRKGEKLNNIEENLNKTKKIEEEENQKIKKRFTSLKEEGEALFKAISELRSKVVDPKVVEQLQSRLNDLEAQKNTKVEERNIIREAIRDKKQCIKQMGEKLDFIQKMNDELSTLKTIIEELKNQKTQSNNVKKQIDSLENMLSTLQNKLAMHKMQVDTEINDLQSHREGDIDPLLNLQKELQSEKKLKKVQVETNKTYLNEKCLERNKLLEEIKKTEEETMSFLCSCQEIYDNEIKSELELRKAAKENSKETS